ncbi:VOC family protein [Paracoccus indicus]|uniref:VOC family protein n=1 Tax=Paracoccus indicus TaxID=2079229 RepID=UPI000D3D254D|nr:VOC family protein [Paracoccus indicus]
MSPKRTIEQVVLRVRDLPAMTAFYEEAIGLRVMGRDGDSLQLGVGSTALVTLQPDPAALPVDPSQAGLYHTAFLLPSRADLSRWLRHADDIGLRLSGASDHGVSEALYLADPEGNGIEIYRDRPESDWPRIGDQVQMTTRRLDLFALAQQTNDSWQGALLGTCIGHVHLQVGDVDLASRFMTRDLGLTQSFAVPDAGWYGWNGYHHHIAANAWNSKGAGLRDPRLAGLVQVVIGAPDRAGEVLTDPWGTSFRMV